MFFGLSSNRTVDCGLEYHEWGRWPIYQAVSNNTAYALVLTTMLLCYLYSDQRILSFTEVIETLMHSTMSGRSVH